MSDEATVLTDEADGVLVKRWDVFSRPPQYTRCTLAVPRRRRRRRWRINRLRLRRKSRDGVRREWVAP